MSGRRASLPVWLGLSWGIAAGCALVGLALAGGSGAVRGIVFAVGLVLLGAAVSALAAAWQTKHPDEDWPVVAGYTLFRAGAGLAALWLALAGGKVALWMVVALLVGYSVWMEVIRRRRGVA